MLELSRTIAQLEAAESGTGSLDDDNAVRSHLVTMRGVLGLPEVP